MGDRSGALHTSLDAVNAASLPRPGSKEYRLEKRKAKLAQELRKISLLDDNALWGVLNAASRDCKTDLHGKSAAEVQEKMDDLWQHYSRILILSNANTGKLETNMRATTAALELLRKGYQIRPTGGQNQHQVIFLSMT